MTLETKVEIFNTIQLFRPIEIHRWYPACDLSAGVSKTILDWFAASRSQEFFVSNCKNKKSYSGLSTQTLFMLYVRDGTGTGS